MKIKISKNKYLFFLIGVSVGAFIVSLLSGTFLLTISRISEEQENFISACGGLSNNQITKSTQYLLDKMNGYCWKQIKPKIEYDRCNYENFLKYQDLLGGKNPSDIVFDPKDDHTWVCRFYSKDGFVTNAVAFR